MKPMKKSLLPLGLDKTLISAFLKKRRKDLDVTQFELAQYCNLSREGIRKIESGKSDIQVTTLVKMSKILGFKINIEIEED